MKQKSKVLFWTTRIDQLILGKGPVGGLTIQMYFWAKTFIENGWETFSFSTHDKCQLEDINFIKYPQYRYVNIFIDLIYSLYIILKIKPKVIVLRGAGRSLFFVRLYAWIIGCKVIYFAASDLDFTPSGNSEQKSYDRIMFRWAIRRNSYFVVQNTQQQTLLKKYFSKQESIIIPNIWLSQEKNAVNTETNPQFNNCVLWVANFRELKRPSWYIDLARNFPDYNFVMIGGATDKYLYQKCANEVKKLSNLHFLGAKPFVYVNQVFAQAKFFVCTSVVEGFPNTFLQSWANGIPVISTFDPSSVIADNNLGIIVNTEKELHQAIPLFNDDSKMNEVKQNISLYFDVNHNAQNAYNKIMYYADL